MSEDLDRFAQELPPAMLTEEEAEEEQRRNEDVARRIVSGEP